MFNKVKKLIGIKQKRRSRLDVMLEKTEAMKKKVDYQRALNQFKELQEGKPAVKNAPENLKGRLDKQYGKLKADLQSFIEIKNMLEDAGIDADFDDENDEETDENSALNTFLQGILKGQVPQANAPAGNADILSQIPAPIRAGIKSGVITREQYDDYVKKLATDTWKQLKE